MDTPVFHKSFDFFSHGVLPAPLVTEDEAQRLAESLTGSVLRAATLGSQQDANFLLTSPEGEIRGVLKVANPSFSLSEIEAQTLAAEHLAARLPQTRFPGVMRTTKNGSSLDSVNAHARVLAYLGGGTLTGSRYLHPSVISALGRMVANISVELRDFHHEGAVRALQWDLRNANRVLGLLAPAIPDDHRRTVVEAVRREVWPIVQGLANELPEQVVHGDITDDNVVCSESVEGLRIPDGIIDFGDLCRSWAVNELAVTISSLLHHDGVTPISALAAIKEFDSIRSLSEAELEALWPLVLLRGAVLVASGNHQVLVDGGVNAYAASALEREWRILECALSVPLRVMQSAIRNAVGRANAVPTLPKGHGPLANLAASAEISTLNLSVTSDALDGGLWLVPGMEAQLANEALVKGASVVVTHFEEFRLTRSEPLSTAAPRTAPTGIDLWFDQETEIVAPWDGEVLIRDGRLFLQGEAAVLVLTGLAARAIEQCEGRVRAGSVLSMASPRERIHVTVVTDWVFGATDLPDFVSSEEAPAWRSILVDPTALIIGGDPRGAVPGTSEADLLRRRDAAFASVQEHYYSTPPQIERGWREHMLSVSGRSYLDMINNVAVLGHGHLGMADAVAKQLKRLNTNSRFHYESVVRFAEELAATLPDPLDTVFLVNSGSEANDLAIRIAMAASGHRDVAAVAEAYHGWTYAADAVSTSTADNPHALSTRPDWIHVLDAPNTYRGRHRGSAAGAYAGNAVARIDELASSGHPLAAFICEPYYGNAGGMALPDGYLPAVYKAVRRHGGLAVADEVQVGYGRLGQWFWGFEQQTVVPDIVTIAKAMGNGHPLGAVITSKAVAERYRSNGYFFSSAGGSPVSSVVGSEVLAEIQNKGLMKNALEVGLYLKKRLEALMGRHDLIGAVHGSGLYLGVELVRDRVTLEPATEEAVRLCDRLLQLGVIVQPTGDRLCVLKVKPPLILDRAGADFFVNALDHALSFGY